MKNEWDMLALVQRELAAGRALIEFSYVTRGLVEPDGRPGRVRDEAGREYEVGPDFLPGVVPALRAACISFGFDNWERVLRFGPGLGQTPDSYSVNGRQVSVRNLTPEGPAQLVELLITESGAAAPDPPGELPEDELDPPKL
ncbi:hypothetical protein [Hymenobacter chitinivorans]|uniref:Uncharacterized protein n=1 Tax=Hymenobacter chitinivorans DSM 11115 TaxID=1121954 RepID=A0A2M9B9A3_9BACT|nr:hypothetical protein [Hymenobacter chitinivorans]PJJ54532.1 hypothetical protein CLV45_2873 [Hymenobacter chitinivorans DSM 11115]